MSEPFTGSGANVHYVTSGFDRLLADKIAAEVGNILLRALEANECVQVLARSWREELAENTDMTGSDVQVVADAVLATYRHFEYEIDGESKTTPAVRIQTCMFLGPNPMNLAPGSMLHFCMNQDDDEEWIYFSYKSAAVCTRRMYVILGVVPLNPTDAPRVDPAALAPTVALAPATPPRWHFQHG